MSTTDITRTHRLPPPPQASDGTLLPRPVVLGFLLFTSLGTGVVLSIVGPTVPAIAARLSVPEATLGIIFTANFLAATITTMASGVLFNRIGGRTLVPAGLAAMVLGLLGEGTAGTLPLIVLAAIMAGVGTGIINVSVNASAARLYPTRRAAVLTWLNVCFGVGAFLTPLAAGLSLVRLGGYTPAYIAGAVIVALPILPLILGLPASDSSAAARSTSGLTAVLTLLRDRTLRLMMLLAALYLGAEIGFGGWVVSIVARMTHLPPAQLAPTASAFWICLAAGGAPTTLLLRRGVPPRRLIVLGALAAAIAAMLLLVVGGSVPLAIACCALLGLAFAPILPLATSLAVGHGAADGSDGARIAAVFTIGQIGAATLPALQGALLGIGVGPALGMTAACGLGMAGLAATVKPTDRTKQA
ncbi:MAG TPA: MFS transporter [Ktedonobacterales bacterium]